MKHDIRYGEVAAKESAYQQQTNGFEVRGVNIPQPMEPGIASRLCELIGYLCELDEVQSSTREKLFGSFPRPAESMENSKIAHEPGIEERAATACQKAACLVSEAKSINSRL